MGKLWLVIIVVLGCILWFEILRMVFLSFLSRALGEKASPFSIKRAPFKTVAVFGDSTAFGVGAGKPEFSVAGRMASFFPRISVENHAVQTIGTKELVSKLEKIKNVRADLIIIHIGGIDVIKLRLLGKLEERLDIIIDMTQKMGNGKVVVFLSQDFSLVPYFIFPFNRIVGRRYGKAKKIYEKVCAKRKALFVDLSDVAPGSAGVVGDIFARDRIHPNDKGYGLWFDRLYEKLKSSGWANELLS